MQEILTELNKEVGVKGSLMVTHDGMLIASALGLGLQEDVVAAVSSGIVLGLRKSLSPIDPQMGDFHRFVLTATYGKMIFEDTGLGYLVAVLDRDIDLEQTLIGIQGMAHRIRTLGRIES